MLGMEKICFHLEREKKMVEVYLIIGSIMHRCCSMFGTKMQLAQSAGAVEYTDCTSAEG